jgi:hypothetical protein
VGQFLLPTGTVCWLQSDRYFDPVAVNFVAGLFVKNGVLVDAANGSFDFDRRDGFGEDRDQRIGGAECLQFFNLRFKTSLPKP